MGMGSDWVASFFRSFGSLPQEALCNVYIALIIRVALLEARGVLSKTGQCVCAVEVQARSINQSGLVKHYSPTRVSRC